MPKPNHWFQSLSRDSLAELEMGQNIDGNKHLKFKFQAPALILLAIIGMILSTVRPYFEHSFPVSSIEIPHESRTPPKFPNSGGL
jgi:hypothetical protein